jgi:hypothetical protein
MREGLYTEEIMVILPSSSNPIDSEFIEIPTSNPVCVTETLLRERKQQTIYLVGGGGGGGQGEL